MGLFKSKEQRRIERDMQVRQGVAAMRKQLKDLEKNEKMYLEKARRAKRIGSTDQLNFLKNTIRKTMSQRMMMERQMLTLETAMQMKNQAESASAFAKSMNAVSRSIGEVFNSTDLAKTQQDFEIAMTRAQTMEERMNIFLETSTQSLTEGSYDSDSDLVSDAELDNLIDAGQEGAPKIDKQLEADLQALERELEG